MFLGHVIVAAAADAVRVETGLRFSEFYVSQADWVLFPAIIVLGLLSGLIPAVQAYRTGVLKNLTPIS